MNNSNSNAFRGHYSNYNQDSLNHQATSPYPPTPNGNRNVTQSGIERNAPLEERFLDWFNHPFESIYKKDDNPWITSKFPLSNPREIVKLWRSPKQLIGLRFGKLTNYGLIDIDSHSPYYSEEGIKQIKGILEDIGIIDTILIQSSYSEGYHLYYFLPVSVPSFKLATAVSVALIEAGLEIKDGILEIFPNRKAWKKEGFTNYKGHRLPLQPQSGSFILDDDFCPYSEDINHFLDLADLCADSVDLDLLREALETAKDRFQSLNKVVPLKKQFNKSGLSDVAQEWKHNLEQTIKQGWNDYHQTNDLLKVITTYGIVFKGLSGEQLINYVYTKAIASPGYSEYCRHKHHIKKRVHDWCYHTERNGYYTPYCSWPDRLGGKGVKTSQNENKGLTNEEKRRECMIRVIECMEDLIEGDRLPSKVGERRKLISMLCHCSERTLSKSEYLPLWHPKYYVPSSNPSNTVTEPVVEEKQTFDHTPLLRVVSDPPPKKDQKNFKWTGIELSENQKINLDAAVLPPSRRSDSFLAETGSMTTFEDDFGSENHQESVLLESETLATQGFEDDREDLGQENGDLEENSEVVDQTCDHSGSNLVSFPLKTSDDNFSSG